MSNKQYRTFNTYIPVTENIEEILSEFKNKCEWYIGQYETSAHGLRHIQLVFGWKTTKKSKAVVQSMFPYPGHIQVTENPASMVKYCSDEKKREADTEILVHGEVPKFRDGNVKTDKTQELIIQGALDTGNFYDAMKFIEENDIVGYIRNRKSFAAYFEHKFAEPDKCKYPIESFKRPLFEFNKRHLVFIGATDIGKTQFALAHFKNPLLVRNKQDWTRYNPEKTDGIVLDDLAFRNWQAETMINTLEWDMDRTERVLYGHCRIKAGTPQIICCNSLEAFYPKGILDEHKEAIDRRVTKHEFFTKLY